MKQLEKNGVAVKLTKKNYKKIYKTLKMFKERLEYSREDQLDTQLENPECAFGFNGTYWCVLSPINKVLIKNKQLRNILYAEHCKEGDYIICRNTYYGDLNSDYIVKFKSSNFMPDGDGDYEVNYDKAYCTYDKEPINFGWLQGQFIRYATQEEIDLLEGKKEKIAVRVDNEKEFNALMKYYDSLGFKPYSDITIECFRNGEAVEFNNDYRSTSVEIQERDGYKIIPFSEFAKEHGIRVPLLLSEDGVGLCKGDEFYGVSYNKALDKWSLNNFHSQGEAFELENIDCEGDEDFPYVSSPATNKAFSTKQAALDWIEAQKPSYTVNEYGMVLEKGNAMPQLAIHNPDLIEGILEYLNNK